VILDRAIRRGTANVVLCRLRYRLEQLAAHDAGSTSAGAPTAPHITKAQVNSQKRESRGGTTG
jgi:hypothetical protein